MRVSNEVALQERGRIAPRESLLAGERVRGEAGVDVGEAVVCPTDDLHGDRRRGQEGEESGDPRIVGHEVVGGAAHHHDVTPRPERPDVGARRQRAHGSERDDDGQRVVDQRRAEDGEAAEGVTDQAGPLTPDGAGEPASGPASCVELGTEKREIAWQVDGGHASRRPTAVAREHVREVGGGDEEPPAREMAREVLVVRARAAEPVRQKDEREAPAPRADAAGGLVRPGRLASSTVTVVLPTAKRPAALGARAATAEVASASSVAAMKRTCTAAP